ncbi:MAG: ABC transporter permease [Candidatus Eisenbacteria bacterium]|uniref:ABC transporter permease n=1 Tax=Eiseniibacteriota bacterium TaxID=2212470 RepID=A0A948W8W5_UNCEI|nr:ABC transporter permease [Candidatus Eisenbacteria bacterium]MBU1950747.1 ABC transporter permease [Candidatus Eisenbacteria bacterium]MBU2693116.1 ABC transporter permease [Candidatus Eisenbacteria bacterium]
MQRLNHIIALAATEIRLTLRDRGALLWIFLMPLVFGFFFGSVIPSGSSSGSSVALNIVDLDLDILSRQLVSSLQGEGFTTTVHDTMPARDKLYRALIIPKGLTRNILSGQRDSLQFIQTKEAGTTGTMAAQVRIHKVIVRTLSALTETLAETPAETGEKHEVTEKELNALFQRPDLVTIKTTTARADRDTPGGFKQSMPGMIVMFVLQMSLIYGGIFMVLDRQTGRLRRLATTPAGPLQIFLGKILGLSILALMQTFVLVVVSRFLFHLHWGSPIALSILILAYIFSVASLGITLGAFAKTPEQARGLGLLFTMILSSLGGCWWPMEIVPKAGQIFGHLFPTAWAMDGMHQIISFGNGVSAILMPALVLCGYGLLFLLAGTALFRRVL